MDDQYSPPQIDSLPASKKPEQEIMSPAAAVLNRSNFVAKCARMILSSYRRDDFADPEGYLAQLGVVLERYSDEIIKEVTDPRTGIQRTCKWPPSIAEFVEFCDEVQRRSTFSARWDGQKLKQLAEREEFERNANEESAEHRAAVVKRLWGNRKLERQ